MPLTNERYDVVRDSTNPKISRSSNLAHAISVVGCKNTNICFMLEIQSDEYVLCESFTLCLLFYAPTIPFYLHNDTYGVIYVNIVISELST